LNQALHTIRQAVGADAVRSRGREEIGLSDGAIACDAISFERNLMAGELVAALDLYRGDLLPGLFAREADGFERWLDAERVRLRRQAGDTAARLAQAEEEADNTVGAVRWLERALEIAPTDESLVRRLIGLLHRAGDRSGALSAFERFDQFMEKEYAITSSEETRALADLVRQSDTVPPSASEPGGAAEGPVRSIAVLPLLNLGADEGRAYSADGMTEALVTELGRIRSLRVISHQSVQQFKGSRLPIHRIARMLGVEALVEGSVLEAGGRVRVTAQLVRAEPEQHLWADAFEGDARDVISVHRDLARSISAAVTAALSVEEERQLASARSLSIRPPIMRACRAG
jgi:TolB-like protein